MKNIFFVLFILSNSILASQSLDCSSIRKVTIYSGYIRMSLGYQCEHTPNDIRMTSLFKIETIDKSFICELVEIINEIERKKELLAETTGTVCQLIIDFESCSFGIRSYCFEFSTFSINDDINTAYTCDFEDVRKIKNLFRLVIP